MKMVLRQGKLFLLLVVISSLASFALSFGEDLFSKGRLAAFEEALASGQLNISEPCEDGFRYMNASLGKEWPWRVLDSWGRSEAGVIIGNTVWEGDYEACMLSNKEDPYFNAKAFELYWEDPDYQFRSVGTCLPDSCTTVDARVLLCQGVLLEGMPIPFNASSAIAIEKKDISNDPYAIITLVIIAIFICIAIVASCYDGCVHSKPKVAPQTQLNGKIPITHSNEQIQVESYRKTKEDSVHINTSFEDEKEINNKDTSNENIQLENVEKAQNLNGNVEAAPSLGENIDNVSEEQTSSQPTAKLTTETPKPGKCIQLLLAFSLYTNVPRLLSTAQPKGSFKCLHAMRFLAMCWILLGHTWQIGVTAAVTPTLENRISFGPEYAFRFTQQVINKMYVAVECFFVLSAMLTTYSLLRQLKKLSGKFTVKNYALFFFHRYWRLTPVYAFLLMFFTALFPHLGSGPFYPSKEIFPDVANCDLKWWTHLLYLNNLVYVYQDCMGWTWYLANDFQFYVLSPLVIVPLYRKPKLGYALALTGLIGSQVTNLVLSYLVYFHKMDFFHEVYIRPYTRCGPYFLGILVGAFLFHKDSKLKMNKKLAYFLLVCSFIVVQFVTHFDMPDPAFKVFWEPFIRIGYAAAVALVILLCTTGNGGIVNRIFSWSGWVPVAKLTYTGYLIHPMLLYYGYYVRVKQIYVSDWLMINYFFGTFMLTMGFSFCVSLLFEIPMLGIEKILLPRDKKNV